MDINRDRLIKILEREKDAILQYLAGDAQGDYRWAVMGRIKRLLSIDKNLDKVRAREGWKPEDIEPYS